MANGFIRVAIDSLGKRLQTFANTIDAIEVHSEAVTLVDNLGTPISVAGGTDNPLSVIAIQSPGLTNTELRSQAVSVTDAAFGASDDPPAGDDTGTYTYISLFKRLLQKITAAFVGAPSLNVIRATASSTAGTLAIARDTRKGILIRNLDATLTIYVGPATVTTSNGFPILPGESCPFSWTGLIQVISASGTPAYAAWDEYF